MKKTVPATSSVCPNFTLIDLPAKIDEYRDQLRTEKERKTKEAIATREEEVRRAHEHGRANDKNFMQSHGSGREESGYWRRGARPRTGIRDTIDPA